MFKISTEVRNRLVGDEGMSSILGNGIAGEIRIFAGTEPPSPDDAIGAATLLCTITVDGFGGDLGFDSVITNGVLTKDPAQIWKGTCVASGTASFYRMVDHDDDNSADPEMIRLQGAVGVVNADLLLASTSLSISQEQRIDYFAIGMPAS